MSTHLSKIPQVEVLLQKQEIATHIANLGRPMVSELITEVLNTIRSAHQSSQNKDVPSEEEIVQHIIVACKDMARTRIHRLINATGIVLHTNLGRSPLPPEVWKNCASHLEDYAAVEIDVNSGKRSSRFPFLIKCICKLTGAEDAVIVNNNAAAVFLLLRSLAENKEVIVTRGQQIQIGGGFRIPDIMEQAECHLKPVGTTNITTIKDITSAITAHTAMMLWVHTSNYKIRGFTKTPHLSEIKKQLPSSVLLAVNQGSGNLIHQVSEEECIHTIIKQGADLVCFSGDKMLGGPQAGFIVGKKEYITTIKKHPLMRTYRVGRAVASMMEESLIYYMNGGLGVAGEALALTTDTLKQRGRRLLSRIPKGKAKLVSHPFSLGGGSTPDQAFDSLALKLTCSNPKILQEKLREQEIPIIAFISNDELLLHLATINPKDYTYIGEVLTNLLGEETCPM